MNDELEQLEGILKDRINDLENIISGKHKRKTKEEVKHEINALRVVLNIDIPKIRKNRGTSRE